MNDANIGTDGSTFGLALRARLVVAMDTLPIERAADDESTADLIQRLALHAKFSGDSPTAWLTFIALSGCFPTANELADLRRELDLANGGGAIVAALASTITAALRSAKLDRAMRVESSAIVVDVNFCATHEHNTGIQRVVRQVIPRWVEKGHDLTLVAWTGDGEAMRGLSGPELDRVLHWDEREFPESSSTDDVDTIIVPWKTKVFLPEVPLASLCAPLTALAESSGNHVSAIGYDAIPLVSAESQNADESQRFAKYLALIKHTDSVLGISESAAREFRGFATTLAAQGLDGPQVASIPLAVGAPHSSTATVIVRDKEVPLVVCVGSHEPRKNQETVLHAARTLFRQGENFRMVFVGGGNRSNLRTFDKRLHYLRKSGFDITSRRHVTDAELWQLYAEARFSVFISLHEGFGLPVGESLALGTPVLTSNYGSLAEIADGGGCVTVNPRSDEQVVAAMRKLLSDDSLVAKLTAEAAARLPRTWDDYSVELWAAVGFSRGPA